MHTKLSALYALLFLAVLGSRARAGDVLVVSRSGGGTFTEIQAAVDAAQDGDAILIRAGTYARFSVDDKALTIVGDYDAEVQVEGSIEVRDLGADKTLVMLGLSAVGSLPAGTEASHGLIARNNAGRIRAESCRFVGNSVVGQSVTGCADGSCNVGTRVASTAELSLTRCTVLGGKLKVGFQLPASGSRGIDVRASTLVVYDSSVQGREGNDGSGCGNHGGHGGDGGWASNTLLLAAGSSFRGGKGGRTDGGDCLGGVYGGDGGHGIELAASQPGSTAHLLDTQVVAGSGGSWTSMCSIICGNNGSNGHAREGTTFVDMVGAARRMVAPSPAREQTLPTFRFQGLPNERVALLLSSTPASPSIVPSWFGFLMVRQTEPALTLPLGTTDATGVLEVDVLMPTLEPGESFRTVHLQSVFVDSQARKHLGTPSTLVVLDSTY
jgi:hypothetical protein